MSMSRTLNTNQNEKGQLTSTKITLPEETQTGADSILIGAWDVNNKQVDKRLQIWIAYPDSRFEEAAKKAAGKYE